MTVTDPALGANAEGLNFDLGEDLNLVRDEARKFAKRCLGQTSLRQMECRLHEPSVTNMGFCKIE